MDQSIDSSKLKIDYLTAEVQSLSEMLAEQKRVNNEYLKLVNGRTDMKMLLSVMQSEQEMLKQHISKLMNERNQAVSKCLILEQILQVTQQENKLLLQESETRIKQYQQQLQQYQQQIQENQEVDSQNSGYIIKFKQVINVNEATLKLHQEIENYKNQLVLIVQKLQKVQESKNDLMQLNFTLSNEICRLKIQPQQKGIKNIDKYIHQLVEAQKKLLECENEDSDKDFPSSPLMNKITQNKGMVQMQGLPKLDLKRAQQIQAITLQQINMKQLKVKDTIPSEEMQQLITEYKYLKNNYTSQRILYEQLEMQFEDINKKYNETLSINATLIRANQNLEEKWQSINKCHNQYKEFYLQYKDYTDIFNKSLSFKKVQETVSERKDLCDFSLSDQKGKQYSHIQQRRSSVNMGNHTTSIDSTVNCINYREKLVQMTKDVFQIFKKKHKENESSDEEIPQVNQMKREFQVSNTLFKQTKKN